MLSNYEISFGIISSSDHLLDGLPNKKLCTDRMVLVYSNENVLAQCKQIRKEDLAEQAFVIHSRDSTTRKLADKWASDIGLKINPYLEISSVEAITKAVKNNIGISILSEMSIREEAKLGHFLYSELPEYTPTRNIFIIYNEDHYMPDILKEFIDLFVLWSPQKAASASPQETRSGCVESSGNMGQ
jgi:DNA-binding transcriptional LysR family regulator